MPSATRPVHLLVVSLAERFRKQKGKDISRDKVALVKLLDATVRAVKDLQQAEQVDVHVPYIATDKVGPLHLRLPLTREEALRVAKVRDVDQLLD